MREVYKNLYIGCENDYEELKDDKDYYFVLAAKNPYHKQFVQYEGKNLDKNHPEYLAAFRDRKLILNMVDAPEKKYFKDILFNYSNAFIKENLECKRKVVVCCNKGKSRSCGIVLWYLKKCTDFFCPMQSLDECIYDFQNLQYPDISLGKGIYDYLNDNWNKI